MKERKKSPLECSSEELDRELIARGAQVPEAKRFKFKDKEGTPARDAVMEKTKELYNHAPSPDEDIDHIGTLDIGKTLTIKTTRSISFVRGGWSDDLMEWYEISDEKIKNNIEGIAIICMKDNLINTSSDNSMLMVKNYGKTFNLCHSEPFLNQPVAAGKICTGFPVKEDIIATAGHFVSKENVNDLRIVFGFKMADSTASVTQIPVVDIYRGVKIISRVCNPDEGDLALVQLDRKVEGQAVLKLAKDDVDDDQEIYVIGHPLGLPLKYSEGAFVIDNTHKAYFSANLDVYSGNCGSPVFDSYTHEVIGIVIRDSSRDFRFVNNCWISIKSPNSEGVRCSRISQLIDIVEQL